MRSYLLVLMVATAPSWLGQASGPYRITHTYPLGGDGGWDYIVPDPPNHRLFIAPAESRDGRRREQRHAAR